MIRQQVVQTLTQLTEGLNVFFQKQQMVRILGDNVSPDMWDNCRKSVASVPPLPQCAVDAWGLVDEENASGVRSAEASSIVDAHHPAIINRRWVALEGYEPFLKEWSGYTKELEWFFQHGVQVLSTNTVLGRLAKTRAERQRALQVAQDNGLHPDTAPRQSMFHLLQAAKYLPKLQLEFRRLFSRLIPATTLQALECEEQDVLNDILGLWRWFAFAPHIVNHLPRLHSRKQLEDVVDKCQNRIHKGLQRLSTASLRLSVRTDVTWNHEPALSIVLDADQTLQLFQVLQPTLELVHRVLREVNDNDMTRSGLTLRWEHLVIVPILAGKSLGRTAWQIVLSVFLSLDSVADLKWWNLIQNELPEDAVTTLMLTEWKQADQRNVMKLGEEVLKLRFMVAHLHDIKQLPDLDIEGYEIAQHYIQQYQEVLTKQFRATLDAITWMAKFVNNLAKLPQSDQQILTMLEVGLQELTTEVSPIPDFSQQVEMPLAMMDSWLTRLEAASNKVLVLQAFASDIIIHQLLDTNEESA